jgi:DNA repair protein RadC
LIYEHFAHHMANQASEQAIVATVDSRLMHTSTTTVSSGTVNETTAHPREILRPVISRNAYGFILIHNHPSGDPSPSRADDRVTENLRKAAELMQIKFLDHIIIGRPASGRQAFYSYRASGVIS